VIFRMGLHYVARESGFPHKTMLRLQAGIPAPPRLYVLRLFKIDG